MNFDPISNHLVPETVIDIGANNGNWALEAHTAWPNAEVLMIEANEECRPYLEALPFPHKIALLSDSVKEVDFYTMKDCRTATGASYYREKTPFFHGDNAVATKRTTTTLDRLLMGLTFITPILVKLDTQGSELDILNGAGYFLRGVSAILVEVSFEEYNEGAPLFPEVCAFLVNNGFFMSEALGDIVHPIERHVIQRDVLWLRLKTYGG